MTTNTGKPTLTINSKNPPTVEKLRRAGFKVKTVHFRYIAVEDGDGEHISNYDTALLEPLYQLRANSSQDLILPLLYKEIPILPVIL